VATQRTRVLVAYHHAILGEGLARMLAEDRSLVVVMADLGRAAELDAALEPAPDVIVLEAGGPMTPDQLMARTTCPTIIDVDLGSTESHAFRRETFPARPADLVARIAAFTGRRHRQPRPAAESVAVPVAPDPVPADEPVGGAVAPAQPIRASGIIG